MLIAFSQARDATMKTYRQLTFVLSDVLSDCFYKKYKFKTALYGRAMVEHGIISQNI